MIKRYLDKKGLTDTDIFERDGIILWGDKIYGYNPLWSNTHEWILRTKKNKYNKENINGAIFIPTYSVDNRFLSVVVRKMSKESPHDASLLKGTQKKSILYNYNLCYKDIFIQDKVFITEGVYDCIKMYKEGIHNVVALLGCSLYEEQAAKIKYLTSNICIALDGDKAGIEGRNKIIKDYKHLFNFSYLNISKDPDEFIKENGKEALLKSEIFE